MLKDLISITKNCNEQKKRFRLIFLFGNRDNNCVTVTTDNNFY